MKLFFLEKQSYYILSVIYRLKIEICHYYFVIQNLKTIDITRKYTTFSVTSFPSLSSSDGFQKSTGFTLVVSINLHWCNWKPVLGKELLVYTKPCTSTCFNIFLNPTLHSNVEILWTYSYETIKSGTPHEGFCKTLLW